MEKKIEKTVSEESKLSRREALAKLGKFGAYSAPVVSGLVSPLAFSHTDSPDGTHNGIATFSTNAACLTAHTSPAVQPVPSGNQCTGTQGDTHKP